MWRVLSIPFDDERLYGDAKVDATEDGGYDPIDLMLLDYGVAIKWLESKQNTKYELGLFPMMARMYLGNNLASSFVERMNSAAKLVMGTARTSLSPEELRMLVVLRINRDFMVFMKTHHRSKNTKAE